MAVQVQPIRIVPLIPVPEEVVNALVSPLSSIFHTDVSVEQSLRGVTDAVYDRSRAQYNSTSFIRELLRIYQNSPTKIIGITSVDLFVPILTYVFGEAQLNGTTAVMSMHRLDDTLYGMAPNPVLYFERSLKEAIHELGHTYGLLHCRSYGCAMHASTTAEDIDLKAASLCEECLIKVGIV